MIVLIGESCSGKSTVEKVLCEKYGYERVISYTTRPKRDYEVDGIAYHFISDEIFLELINNDFFAEHTNYRDWHYGASKKDCALSKLIVVEPHGLRQLKKLFGESIVAFYLKLNERERLIRIVKRGDDLMECFRRIISDQGVFQNVEDECNFIVECDGLQVNDIAKIIHSKYAIIKNNLGDLNEKTGIY